MSIVSKIGTTIKITGQAILIACAIRGAGGIADQLVTSPEYLQGDVIHGTTGRHQALDWINTNYPLVPVVLADDHNQFTALESKSLPKLLSSGFALSLLFGAIAHHYGKSKVTVEK